MVKNHYKGYTFAFLATENVSRDAKDIRVNSNRVKDQPWSSHVPYRVPEMDLRIFEKF